MVPILSTRTSMLRTGLVQMIRLSSPLNRHLWNPVQGETWRHVATCGGELPFASSILNIHSELFRRSIFLSAQIGQLPAPKSLQVHDTIRSANIKLESRRRRTKGSVVGEQWCQNAAPLR